MAIPLLQYHLFKRQIFYPLKAISVTPLSKINWPYVCGSDPGLIPSLALPSGQRHTGLTTASLPYVPERGRVHLLTLFCVSRVPSRSLGSFAFPYKFHDQCVRFRCTPTRTLLRSTPKPPSDLPWCSPASAAPTLHARPTSPTWQSYSSTTRLSRSK